jgi:hypothetical protein
MIQTNTVDLELALHPLISRLYLERVEHGARVHLG